MARHDDFNLALEMLERRIKALPDDKRHLLQHDLHVLVERMIENGMEPPERVRVLDDVLTDAAIEAQFDNMPV